MKINISIVFLLILSVPYGLKSQSLKNFQQSIETINTQTKKLCFSTKGFDIPRQQGHYQGIQVYEKENNSYVYISGSSKDRAYVSVIALNQKSQQKELYILDTDPYRHAGGIQIYDHYLVVGVEDNAKRTTSKVQIYSLEKDPLAPQKLLEIQRDGDYEISTAGAVAMTSSDGIYFLAVGSWDCQTIDFYTSNGKSLEDPSCSFRKINTWERDKADRSQWSDKEFASYQNLNLLSDAQGEIYMLGLAQTGDKEVIDLYHVNTSNGIHSSQRIIKVLKKEVPLKKTTFKAGGGIWINKKGALSIFACHHRKSVIEIVGEFSFK